MKLPSQVLSPVFRPSLQLAPSSLPSWLQPVSGLAEVPFSTVHSSGHGHHHQLCRAVGARAVLGFSLGPCRGQGGPSAGHGVGWGCLLS